MSKKLLTFALSIMMVFTMTPMIAFANPEEEVNEPETIEEPAAEETPEIDGQQTEDTIDVDAAKTGNNVSIQAENPKENAIYEEDFFKYGTARQENVGQYANSMRIYCLYLHRDGGSNSSDRYGDAVLIESNGRYLLMDMGANAPVKNKDDVYASNIVSALNQIGVKELDIYISHMHKDHVGGRMIWDSDAGEYKLSEFGRICSNFKVNKVYMPDIETCQLYESPEGRSIYTIYNEKMHELYGYYYRFYRDSQNRKIKKVFSPQNPDAEIVFLSPSFRSHAKTAFNYFNVGAARFDVIGPVGTYRPSDFDDYVKELNGYCGTAEGHCLNNCSLCTIVSCGSFRYISTGDIEKHEEANLVNTYGYGLNCDVMKVPHHSLRTSGTDYFTSRVSPMWSFEENHGYTDSRQDAINVAKKYGYNYGVASNKHSLIFDINNSAVRVFRDYNNNNYPDDGLITGWVSCGGGTQYYDGAGYIHTGWNWLSGYLYYMSGTSGFRYTGSHKINGVKVKFNSSGKLTSHSKPAKVKARSAKGKKGGKIKVSWKKASRASSYQVYRATSKKGTYVYLGTYGKGKRSLTNGGLIKGKRYYYKVRALRNVAGGTMYGAFSNVKSAKAK